MDDEEEDYMSDKFITPICDKVPGLTTVKSIQRQRNVELKRKNGNIPSRAEVELQRRTEGLEKQVDSTNKGFNMLLKMGYAPGKGLGKNAEGRAEPVPIEVRSDRAGLGRDTAEREREKFIQHVRQQIVAEERNQFLGAMSAKFRLSRAKRQLEAARHICLRLDTECSISVPVHPSFWPVPEVGKPQVAEVRERANRPRRRRSGVSRQKLTDSDLEDRDRSPFYDDRDQLPQLSDDDELTTLDADDPVSGNADAAAILTELVAYLRDRYSYCFWCSAQFANRTELNDECPGPHEEDHN